MKTLALTLTALGVARVLLSAQYPIITNQPASRAVWAGGSVTLAVGVSNAGEFSYQWQLNTTNLPSAIITTVAGNSKGNYSGDGGAATNASLSCFSVAVDGSGNLFIADGNNNRIRKVDTNGVITTFAGSGTPGHLGDGGAATNANLYQPTGVVVDGSGNLFIADHFHYLIRKVDTNGIITTVAGGGHNGLGDGGAATNASLYQPSGVAVDALGNLFIADDYNSRIRKVDTNGIITTVAGNGTLSYCGDGGAATNACLDWPAGVTVDAFGNLFIADELNNRVRKVDTNGIITTVAGGGHNGLGDGGAATNASLDLPYGVAVDASGNLLIADSINYRIRKVDTNGIITTVAGGGHNGLGDGGAATSAALWLPEGVAVDASGNLFIADEGANRIRKVTNIQQGPTLSLTNLTAANAGNYQVVVTGPGGSVTSSVAALIVATSPLIYQTVLNSNGSVSLSCVSQPSSTNVLLCTTNLLPPVLWQSLSTKVAGDNGDWQYTDTDAVNWQMRFYRSATQ